MIFPAQSQEFQHNQHFAVRTGRTDTVFPFYTDAANMNDETAVTHAKPNVSVTTWGLKPTPSPDVD